MSIVPSRWKASVAGALAALALLGAACSREVTPVDLTTSAALKISFTEHANADPRTAFISCGDSVEGPESTAGSGWLADKQAADAACRQIMGGALGNRIADGNRISEEICLPMMHGPETLIVSGQLQGRAVIRNFARQNSCAERDWVEVGSIRP